MPAKGVHSCARQFKDATRHLLGERRDRDGDCPSAREHSRIADLERGAQVVISQHPRRAKPIVIDLEIYKWRHLIENFFCKLKEFIHIALGVRADGAKEVLGLWLEQNEGAKFWLRVMNELKTRGVADVLIVSVRAPCTAGGSLR